MGVGYIVEVPPGISASGSRFLVQKPIGSGRGERSPEREFGIRVISTERVHAILNEYAGSAALRVADICNREGDGHTFGWSLESFFEEVIQCSEGYLFDGAKDAGLNRLFSRKSGPIFCIVEVVIEVDA